MTANPMAVAAALPSRAGLRAAEPPSVLAHAWARCLREWPSAQRAHGEWLAARLRCRAAAPLRAGQPLADVAHALGVRPVDLAAAHAVPFDAAESPLKARALSEPAAVLQAALALHGTWQASWPGLRLFVAGDCGSDGAIAIAAPPAAAGSVFALQQGAADTWLQGFGAAGDPQWTWRPADGHGAGFDVLVRGFGRLALRGGADTASGTANPGAPGHDAGRSNLLPPGAGWDLLLQAAAHALPVSLAVGAAPRLTVAGCPRSVQLDGRALRVELGPTTLWLDDDAPVALAIGTLPDEAGAMPSLTIALAPGAGRAAQCAWARLAAAARHDEAAPACSC
jgi:hypothetical protein